MEVEEKIKKVIELFGEGQKKEAVAEAVGYSTTNSLSRFMLTHDYRWDKRINNYVTEAASKQPMYQVNNQVNEQESSEGVSTSQAAAFSLLENPDVISLLNQSQDLLVLLEKPVTESKLEIYDTEYNFWKNAQKFSHTRKASIATSLRLPNDLNEELAVFRKKTSLTQTQVICMALDYFMNQFKSVADK